MRRYPSLWLKTCEDMRGHARACEGNIYSRLPDQGPGASRRKRMREPAADAGRGFVDSGNLHLQAGRAVVGRQTGRQADRQTGRQADRQSPPRPRGALPDQYPEVRTSRSAVQRSGSPPEAREPGQRQTGSRPSTSRGSLAHTPIARRAGPHEAACGGELQGMPGRVNDSVGISLA